jgi:RNA polymerase-associated protein LEO1
MQAKGRLSTKLTFRPATLDSKTHKRLTAAIDKKHGHRATRTMAYVSRVDPEREKEALDAELEKAARESAALLRKQQRMMREDRDRRYESSRPEPGYTESYYERRDAREETTTTTGSRMDADFLEDEDEEDEEKDDFDADAEENVGTVDRDISMTTKAPLNDDDYDDEDDQGEPKERRKRRMVDDEDDDE